MEQRGFLTGWNFTRPTLAYTLLNRGMTAKSLFLVAAIAIVYGVVVMTQAERQVPITHAKQVRGGKTYGGTTSYLPLRLNQAGVIPIIFALSNPPARAESIPADLIAWTDGRALIATGSPFAPVTHKGVTYVVGQINNAMLYPGLALGAIVSQSSRISDGMFSAAAHAVSSLVTVRQPGSSLLPHIDDLRKVSVTVAGAVAEVAVAEGLARVRFDDIVGQIEDAMWQPEYRQIKAS